MYKKLVVPFILHQRKFPEGIEPLNLKEAVREGKERRTGARNNRKEKAGVQRQGPG